MIPTTNLDLPEIQGQLPQMANALIAKIVFDAGS